MPATRLSEELLVASRCTPSETIFPPIPKKKVKRKLLARNGGTFASEQSPGSEVRTEKSHQPI